MAYRYLDGSLSRAPSAYGEQPLEPHEIDEHVDGARIWATIAAIREEAEQKLEHAKESDYDDEEDIQSAQLVEDAHAVFTQLIASYNTKDLDRLIKQLERVKDFNKSIELLERLNDLDAFMELFNKINDEYSHLEVIPIDR